MDDVKARKVAAIITATTKSPSFPGRSLLVLGKKTVLSIIVDKFMSMDLFGTVILCTSSEQIDDQLSGHARDLGIHVVRGDASSILHRLIKAYTEFDLQDAVIIRGDCPLFDLEYTIKLFDLYMGENADYAYSEHHKGLPYGTGSEIVSVNALNKMLRMNTSGIYNEKFSTFIKLHKNIFTIAKLNFSSPEPDLRFAVENNKDYEFVKELFTLTFNNYPPDVHDCIRIVGEHPYLKNINKPDNEVKEIGVNKILLFPEKIKNIVGEFDYSFPVSVELTLTNSCNLTCKWCSDKSLRKNQPGFLSLEIYKRLVNSLFEHGTKGLVIEGGGEPTIYPYFTEALNFALDSGLAVGLITNGVVFNYADSLNKLEWVRISLDADSPENFKYWKGADKFDKVLGNIKQMCECKGDCVVGIGYVVTKYNIENLEEIVILLADYGVDYIYLRPVIDHPDLSIKEKLFYLQKYTTETFSVMIHAMEENSISGNAGLPCVAHSLSSVIAGDGSVYICGRLNIYDWIKPIGNINSQAFYDIWHGEERKNQIEMLKDADFCRANCPECRLTKYNILLNNSLKIKTRNFI